jgi:ATPase subunit of ABC transporter with duplicated ATPase domains
VLYIDQDARTPDKTVMQFVLDGDTEMAALLRERDALMAAGGSAAVAEGAARFAEVQSELALLDGGEANVRARRALAALGFAPEQTGLPLRNFSGGWRVKASLARALFCPPRFLFLDEPTNHLDLHEIIRLQQLLRRLDESCIVVVSHDRAFLDAVATDMMVLRDRKIAYFSGNLSAYLKDKEDRRIKQQRLYDAQERKRAHIQATIDKGVQTARRTGNDKVLGMVASRKKKLNERLGAEKREDGKRWRTNTRRATDTQKKYETAVDGARQEVRSTEAEQNSCRTSFAMASCIRTIARWAKHETRASSSSSPLYRSL